jgi:hypothetical protein
MPGLLTAVAALSQLTRQIHHFSDLSHRLSTSQQDGPALVPPASTRRGGDRGGPPAGGGAAGGRAIG